MRTRLMVTGVVAASGLLASNAQAMIQLDIEPRKPTVAKAIKVGFAVKKKLPSNQRYRSTVSVKSGSKCSSAAVKETDSNPAKGKRVTFRFVPEDDAFNKASRWCKGTAGASVQIVRKSDDGVVRILGIESFTISG